MMQFGNVNSIKLDDPDYFEILGGLWTGKKPPFTKAGVIRNTNFTASGEVDYSDVAWLDVEIKQFVKRKLRYGDIIIERSGGGPKQPVGRVVQFKRLDEVFSFSNFTTTVRVKKSDELEPLFAFYILLELYRSGRTDDIQRRTTGLRNLDFKAYKERAIFPLIPMFEQYRIVHILATVQTAIEQQVRLIKLTRELKSTLMHELYTEGLRGEKQKMTEMGLVPDSWEIIKLGDLVNIRTGKLDSNAATTFGQYPFFTCSPETARIDTFAFDTEAILLAGNNARGIYSVKHYKGKFNAYQRTYVLTQKDESQMPYSFLLYALATNLEYLRTVSIGTSTKYLTLGILQNLPIIKPDYEEAKEIGNALTLLDKKIEITHQKKQIFEELFRALLHQLMTGQNRVHEINLPGLS